MGINILQDAPFLRQLDIENLKTYYVKILVLDKNEIPIRAIEGRISSGSLSINGNSSIRRAGSLTFLAEEFGNDLSDIDNLISMNKKIKILIGIENKIDKTYDDIIWFNQGIYIITQPSLQHNLSGVTISLQLKDKMCLLNGECGGNLPTSVTFHQYDQIIGYDDYDGNGYSSYPLNPNNYTVYKMSDGTYVMWDATVGWFESTKEKVGEVVSITQRIFDIIQTLVCNFGNENIANIIINDIPLKLKASVRYIGSETLYYNEDTSAYTTNADEASKTEGNWVPYSYNEDCGYIYTDFTYPGELVSAIGDNVCSILDKIINVLGNYEYFYDVDGHFIFQEKKNNLNTSYEAAHKIIEETSITSNDPCILNSDNYYVDFSNTSSSIYTFDEGSALITSYSNNPNYLNIKNDYHIWGKNEDGLAIHYHLAIKNKPLKFSTWNVIDITDAEGGYTGQIDIVDEGTEGSYLYTPTDWRAELYLQGLQKKKLQQRPDIYEQELLDLFDSIYNMKEHQFKTVKVNHPNDLNYWFDYINPYLLSNISIDTIGTKMHSYQKDNIIKLYNCDIPDVVLINANADARSQASLISECEKIGQPYSRVPQNVYNSISVGTVGYTAQETARDLLYQYTNYNSSISITSIPIYYLDVNSRITVQDNASGIKGDYIINSINLPLDAKETMTISASSVLIRI